MGRVKEEGGEVKSMLVKDWMQDAPILVGKY